MPDINNLDNLINTFGNLLSSINNNMSKFSDIQTNIMSEIERSSTNSLRELQQVLTDNETKLKRLLDEEIQKRENNTQNYINDINNLKNTEKQYLEAAAEARTEQTKQELTQKAELFEQEIQQKQAELEVQKLINEGKFEEANNLRNLQNDIKQAAQVANDIKKAQNEEDKRLAQKFRQEAEAAQKERLNFANSIITGAVTTGTSILSNAINSVANVYEQHASTLSAALDVTVSDISKLQNDIANTLQSEGLSGAISNVQVLNEAATMVRAGYTNVDTLQQNATDIAVSRQIAPNIDFNNSSVRNLINVFGSDFTTKFAAIQAATQETAGSTVSMAATLSTLMTDLEPVYLNAELQSAALQGTADVSATLSNAREQGLISEGQEAQYRSMLTELMDPSRAFKSNNVAVRVAATQYQWDGNPANALNALLNATKQMYGNVGQSNSSDDILSRSLYASAMGMDSMSAAYNPEGYTDVNMLSASDLGSTYEEQLSNLQSGDYTTRSASVRNQAENSGLTQYIGNFAKSFPNLYRTYSTMIISAINNVPRQLLSGFGSTSFVAEEMEDIYSDSSMISKGSGSGTTNKGRRAFTIRGSSPTPSNPTAATGGFRGKLSNVNQKLSNKLTGGANWHTSGMAMLGYSAGITGLGNLISDWDTEDSFWQNVGMNGDIGNSMMAYGGIGAGIGTFFGPLGTAIGGLTGAIAGLITASIAQNEITEENNRLIEEQNNLTKRTLGEGVEALSTLEAKSIVARGGGTVDLNSGTYEIDSSGYNSLIKSQGFASGLDYVPYDNYLARLHKGEAVVTASAAKALRSENPNFWNDTYVSSRNDDVVNALEKSTQSIVRAVNGESDIIPLSNQSPKQYVIKNQSI